jgi:hypothetical protein
MPEQQAVAWPVAVEQVRRRMAAKVAISGVIAKDRIVIKP